MSNLLEWFRGTNSWKIQLKFHVLFLVKLVTQLMIHGAAGFLHKTETIKNIARLARHVPGTHAVLGME